MTTAHSTGTKRATQWGRSSKIIFSWSAMSRLGKAMADKVAGQPKRRKRGSTIDRYGTRPKGGETRRAARATRSFGRRARAHGGGAHSDPRSRGENPGPRPRPS